MKGFGNSNISTTTFHSGKKHYMHLNLWIAQHCQHYIPISIMSDLENGKGQNLGASDEDMELATFMDKLESDIEDLQLAHFVERVSLNDGSKKADLSGNEFQKSPNNRAMLGPAKDEVRLAEGKRTKLELQAMQDAIIVWEDLDQDESCLLDMTGVSVETSASSQSLNNTETENKQILEN